MIYARRLLIIAVFLLAPSFALAAASLTDNTANIIDCFQYYNFGSVAMNINPENQAYSSGETISFKGTVENKNNFPIVSGEIFAKVFRRDSKGAGAPNGEHEIAQFYGVKDLNIDGNKTKNVEFNFTLPKEVVSGEYMVQFFFTVGEKYNLSGLTFHNSIPGSLSSFFVKSTAKDPIYFDKDNIKINGTAYGLRQIGVPFEKDKKIEINVPIINSTAENSNLTVTKDLYYWDSAYEKNKIKTDSENVSVPGNSDKTISYAIDNPDVSVYMVKLTAVSDSGQQTIVNVRPVVKGIFQPRLNFSTLASFPLKKDQKTAIVSCVHNAGLDTKDGKLVMTLKDENGQIIDSSTYSGGISGSMAGVAKVFTPQKDYGKLALTAEIYDSNGKLYDSYTENYDCSNFDPGICGSSPMAPALPTKFYKGISDQPVGFVTKLELALVTKVIIFVISFAVLVLIAFLVAFYAGKIIQKNAKKK